MKKLTPQKVRFWMVTAGLAGAVVYAAGIAMEIKLISGAGVVMIAGALIFHLIFYRCPHCGKYLDRSGGDYCPYCGGELEEGE